MLSIKIKPVMRPVPEPIEQGDSMPRKAFIATESGVSAYNLEQDL